MALGSHVVAALQRGYTSILTALGLRSFTRADGGEIFGWFGGPFGSGAATPHFLSFFQLL
jgi:hypothetical protein